MSMTAFAPQRSTDGKNGPDDDRAYEPLPWTTRAPAQAKRQRIDGLKRRGVISDDAHGRLDPHVAYWTPERAQAFVSRFQPGRRATPKHLEVLRQASRELHEQRGLRGVVHYETGRGEDEAHEAKERKLIGSLARHAQTGAERKTIRQLQALERDEQLERSNDAPSTSPAI
jgi:hypothetical protein